MRALQRFHSKATAVAMAVAVAWTNAPMAQADPPRPPGNLAGAERAAQLADNEELQFEDSNAHHSLMTQLVGASATDPKWFYPTLALAVIPTIAIYKVRSAWNRNTINRYVLRTIKDTKEFQTAFAEANEAAKAASAEIKDILVKAKRADFREIFRRLPAELQREVTAQMRASNIRLAETSTVTIEELVTKLNRLHGANKMHFDVAKRLAPELERALSLRPGTILRQLKDPEVLMTRAYRSSTLLANPANYTSEALAFEREIVRAGARASFASDIPIRGQPWWRAGGNLTRQIWRRTWPALLVGTVVVGGVLWFRHVANEEREAASARNTATLRRQNEEQAILKGVLYNEDALTLMVEMGWILIKDRLRERFPFECPVSFDNANDVHIVSKAFEAANAQYVAQRKNPFGRDREFSVDFFRTFWTSFFRFAAEERDPSLENLRPETLLGPGNDGRGGIIDDLANASPELFRHASRQIREYRSLLASLARQRGDARRRLLDAVTDERTRQILSRRLAELDRIPSIEGDEDGEPKEP